MSVEKFLAKRREQMIGRIEHEVIDWSVDHMSAYRLLNRMAVSLAMLSRPAGEEEAFYASLHEEMLRRLAAHGVEAEVYALRGDISGNGEEDSRNFLRVTGRNGVTTGVPRKRDVLSRVVVRADTESVVLSKRGEE